MLRRLRAILYIPGRQDNPTFGRGLCHVGPPTLPIRDLILALGETVRPPDSHAARRVAHPNPAPRRGNARGRVSRAPPRARLWAENMGQTSAPPRAAAAPPRACHGVLQGRRLCACPFRAPASWHIAL